MNTLLGETTLPTGQSLQLVHGDITSETTDAIVNAANTHLQHGAGLAGAILQKGGSRIQEESDQWVASHGPVSHAAPGWTSGGNLSCRFILHAVGPVWGEGDEDAKLAMAVTGSLRTAEDLGLSSVALPAISTGIFGFPKPRAARIILSAVREYFTRTEAGIKLIRFVLFDRETTAAFEKVWHDTFGTQP